MGFLREQTSSFFYINLSYISGIEPDFATQNPGLTMQRYTYLL